MKILQFRVFDARTNEITTMNKLPDDINKFEMLTDEDLLEYANNFKQWCHELNMQFQIQ
jgi:hypothetical protein